MDPIADMIIRIKNAGTSGKKTASFPYSKVKAAIAKVLKDKGVLKDFSKKGKKVKKTLETEILYSEHNKPKITGAQRISKLSKRVYIKAPDIRTLKTQTGFSVISTSKGIMTDVDAKKAKLGGEVLFKVW